MPLFYLFLISSVAFAQQFQCNEDSSCANDTIECLSNEYCSVECIGDSSCLYSTINCPSYDIDQDQPAACKITCNDIHSCKYLTINAQYSSSLNIISNNMESLTDSNIYCPSICNITFNGNNNNNINIYSSSAQLDDINLNIKCASNSNNNANCWSDYLTIYYGNNYTNICLLDDPDPYTDTIQCINNLQQTTTKTNNILIVTDKKASKTSTTLSPISTIANALISTLYYNNIDNKSTVFIKTDIILVILAILATILLSICCCLFWFLQCNGKRFKYVISIGSDRVDRVKSHSVVSPTESTKTTSHSSVSNIIIKLSPKRLKHKIPKRTRHLSPKSSPYKLSPKLSPKMIELATNINQIMHTDDVLKDVDFANDTLDLNAVNSICSDNELSPSNVTVTIQRYDSAQPDEDPDIESSNEAVYIPPQSRIKSDAVIYDHDNDADVIPYVVTSTLANNDELNPNLGADEFIIDSDIEDNLTPHQM